MKCYANSFYAVVKLPPISTATVMAAQTNKIPRVAQIHFPREDLGLSLRISSVTYNFSLLKNKIQWVEKN